MSTLDALLELEDDDLECRIERYGNSGTLLFVGDPDGGVRITPKTAREIAAWLVKWADLNDAEKA